MSIKFKFIAVDDIRILNSCPAKSNRFCDFENDDLCGYTINDKGGIKWARGNKLGSQTGPNVDQ